MTELLQHAFQKAKQELSEIEQEKLAKFLLQQNLHYFLANKIRFISEYNEETQHAIQEAANHKNLNNYNSCDELFNKLDV